MSTDHLDSSNACALAAAAPRARSDAGFSFAELLVALTLLLFTLVAVLGLSTSSSFMANSARQRSAMVNAGATYLERVRQVPYLNVGTRTAPSGAPTGTLDTSVTATASYIVTVTPTVTWGRPEDPTNHAFKTVSVSVTSSEVGGGSPMSYSTSAVVADIGAAACLDPPDRPVLAARAGARSTVGFGPVSPGVLAAMVWRGTRPAAGRPSRRSPESARAGSRRVIA